MLHAPLVFVNDRTVQYNKAMDFREMQAKSILTPCGIPGIDYVINPYMGCRFGCTYCYASFMGRFLKGKTINDWGEYVYVKTNAPELLKKEMHKKLGARLRGKASAGRGKEILLSSVTDPYQGAEAKYKITRQCLEVLADYGYEGILSILTKSPLVTRDIDILKRFKCASVGLTVTSTDDSISRYFEKYAPLVNDRFKALKELNQNGIHTYAFIGPVLPHYVAQSDELGKIFARLADVGTKDIFVEHLNLSTYIKNRLLHEMKGEDKDVVRKFYFSQSPRYRDDLNKLLEKLIKKYKMNLLLDMVIFHKEFQKTHDGTRPHVF